MMTDGDGGRDEMEWMTAGEAEGIMLEFRKWMELWM